MTAKVHHTVTLHQGRVFRLTRERITLPNGVSTDLEIIRPPGAAAVVPLADERTVLLIRQSRHSVGGYIWEIPAGTLDPGEEPLDCARRELVEETGFSALSWHPLGKTTPLPGYSDERIHIFLAEELSPEAQNLDRDELLTVHRTPLEEAVEMIYRGEIHDGKTLSALLLARRHVESSRTGKSSRKDVGKHPSPR